jgi:heat shock protein HslJ
LAVASALVLGAAVLGGCGGSEQSERARDGAQAGGQGQHGGVEGGQAPSRFPRSSPLARDIWGRTFRATSISGEDDEPSVAQPIQLRVSFSDERGHGIGWQANCNSFGGNVRFTATKMEVHGIGGTLIGCAPEIQEEDEWLTEFMQAEPEWRLDGERLRLISDRATIELTAR